MLFYNNIQPLKEVPTHLLPIRLKACYYPDWNASLVAYLSRTSWDFYAITSMKYTRFPSILLCSFSLTGR